MYTPCMTPMLVPMRRRQASPTGKRHFRSRGKGPWCEMWTPASQAPTHPRCASQSQLFSYASSEPVTSISRLVSLGAVQKFQVYVTVASMDSDQGVSNGQHAHRALRVIGPPVCLFSKTWPQLGHNWNSIPDGLHGGLMYGPYLSKDLRRKAAPTAFTRTDPVLPHRHW